VSLLIADDHFVVREGLRSLISRCEGLVVIGEASNGEEALKVFRKTLPDVVLLDLRMPVCDGLSAIRQIRAEFPGARILVLSSHDGDEDIHSAIEAGAMGYLLKHSSGDQVLPAIRAVMDGRQWISPEASDRLRDRIRTETLTPRERELLQLLAQGEANKQAAAILGLSEETVKTHVRNILGKLQVRDRTEAVTVALRRGIIRLPSW
jgi:two-component system NarL family response regulator